MKRNIEQLPIPFSEEEPHSSMSKINQANLGKQEENFSKKEDLEFFRGDELLKGSLKEIPTLFSPILPKTGLVAIVGASETGKSSLARQLALSTVLGQDFLGFKNNARGKSALIISTEDDQNTIKVLLSQAKQSMSFDDDEIRDLTYLFYSENLMTKLTEILDYTIDVIVVDSPFDIFDGKDFNDGSQVRKFLNRFKEISSRFQCLVIFIHHTGKRTESLTPSKNNILGSQSFEASMRLVLELRLDPMDPQSSIRHLCVLKSNYLSPEFKRNSWVLSLDENLIFHDTGQRVPIRKLSLSSQMPRKIAPKDYPDSDHFTFLDSIFSTEDCSYSQKKLNALIQKRFDISDKPARGFISYYEEMEWIFNESTTPTLNKYKLKKSSIRLNNSSGVW